MKRSEDPCRDPASEERDDWAVAPATQAVKERPMLFSGAMVRAILDGSKTQTRRIVKLGTDSCGDPIHPGDPRLACPYGQPGDRLWVKETWRASSAHDDLAPSKIPVGDSVEYLADPERIVTGKGRPSIFLPRWASRITLEITGIRVERLQDITKEDAKAEGIERVKDRWKNYYGTPRQWISPINSYQSLWGSINGPGSWDVNPFVWVVKFKRITP